MTRHPRMARAVALRPAQAAALPALALGFAALDSIFPMAASALARALGLHL
jgi:hypothetical protein